jgi:hypothetical protein
VLARAVNISTRLQVEPGQNVAIGGFYVAGNAPKRVAIRGLGPSLRSAGFADTALSDPNLELRGPDNTLIGTNDNWRDNPNTAAEIEAAGLALGSDAEAAIVATLAPGAYTAAMSGTNAATGLGLVEIYDLEPTADSQLANLSTRGIVKTGSAVFVGGFIIGGENAQTTVLLRALGPSLASAGIANTLADPVLELHDSNGVLLQSNDNWKTTQQAAIEATGIPPQSDFEAAILATLAPGSYTAIAAGNNGSIGIGLIEVYCLSQQ